MRRRDFLETAALAALAGGCASGRGGGSYAARTPAPDGRLRIAVIGVGGRGADNCRMIDSLGDRVAALCDVDETSLTATQKAMEKTQGTIPVYRDFRVMFDTESPFDAVFICTPDHGHAAQALWALDRFCPVFIEPPLARTLEEMHAIHARATASRVPVCMGTQTPFAREFRRAVSCLATGLLGPVHAVHVWTNRPLWQQGIQRPDGTDPVPSTLDWDLWLGPAPLRPYKKEIYHAYNWRGWRDFGTGALGDAGCHLLSLPFQALSLPSPSSIQCVTGGDAGETYPRASHLQMTFPGKKNGWFGKRSAPVTLDWYDGGLLPDLSALPQVTAAFGKNLPSSACLLVGERGLWISGGLEGREHWLALKGEKKVRGFEFHDACAEISTPRRNLTIQKAFLDRVRLGKQNSEPLGYSLPLMDAVLCGCVAQQLKTSGPLVWNASKRRFEDEYAAQANALCSQPSREEW